MIFEDVNTLMVDYLIKISTAKLGKMFDCAKCEHKNFKFSFTDTWEFVALYSA